ncbi:MAG: DUF2116 family Zn-ribbon domain-containing protein [Candidatus Methanomethylophilaceae archaeon]|jgi:predicted nucleic acid-binding Zn ribbon protein
MTEGERIPQHRHCINCGKAFVGVGNYCGDECRDTSGKEVKKKLKIYVAVLAVIMVATVAIVVSGL